MDMSETEYSRPFIVALVDDLLLASRIEGTLGAHGYDVRIAATVEELRKAARARIPAGIVMSFGSPLLDWRGAIRSIRADAMLAGIPLLAFGPHVDTDARAEATAAGADRVVTNGVFFARMAESIGALVGSRRVGQSGGREADR
jgi:DNA-binding response OmpR family regulator